jgi:hypothetical protein
MLIATFVAGSLGAIHYLISHVILNRPFPHSEQTTDEEVGG